MKRKLLYRLFRYSNIIIYSIFWTYFLVLLILHLLNSELNIFLLSLFFVLLGLWLGSSLSVWIRDRMKDMDGKMKK